ncbi:MAG: DEAD/DEAH box helicase, partial [Porphyromonadaceae bacterium]|nr:DEAD/DEAH box helicase [Porphyromonadaceae bacterium]
DKLLLDREQGYTRNLIVAATGTGKTVISAFDYRMFYDQHASGNRLLFIAHREEILRQALRTYQSVLLDANFGQLWAGSSKPVNSIDHLFITVQSFNSNYRKVFEHLPKDYYQYIVIDEAHHIVAETYRKVIDHFEPHIFLGLTATPERMDGESLLPDFDGRISAEIRLAEALNAGLLTPFQYLCVSDTTDLSDDDLMDGNKYNAVKLSQRLCSKERVGLIIDRLRYYIADEYQCKALCFCASQEHAKFMSDSFETAGFRSAYLTSNNNHEREHLNLALRKGKINYLFVVDIFNEGVDIPEVDTVLFLRPTESLTIFLQQLGRGLRLSPGKSLLTVLDFVGQLNVKYDYISRFRSLVKNRDRDIIKEVKDGFTMLPPGCSIHMEEKAKEYVLQTIKSAIYSQKRLQRELASYSTTPTLTEFINGNGQDIRILYKGNKCWSSLKRDANKISYQDQEFTKTLEKGMGRLIHFNSESFLLFLKEFVKAKTKVHPRSVFEKRYCLMLYYALFQEKLNYKRFGSIYEALAELRYYPWF